MCFYGQVGQRHAQVAALNQFLLVCFGDEIAHLQDESDPISGEKSLVRPTDEPPTET